MKRKVIQIANSTQLVSLPRKWALKHGIKKGDEIDVQEQGNRIVISPEENLSQNFVKELDLTGLDTTSIIQTIRANYKIGYDELKLELNPLIIDFQENQNVEVNSVLKKALSTLIGVEIINQTQTSVTLKEVSLTSFKEFDNVLRRIFFLILDANRNLIKGIEDMDKDLLNLIEPKHDTITRFINFSLRLLNRCSDKEPQLTTLLYSTITYLDKIIDIINISAKKTLLRKKPLPKEVMSLLNSTINYFQLYYDFFYKPDKNRLSQLSKERKEIRKMGELIFSDNFSPHDYALVQNCLVLLELYRGLIEIKLSTV